MFKIIDPHIHFWDLSLNQNLWLLNESTDLLGNLFSIRKNYLMQDYLEDKNQFNIEKVIHIEAVSSGFEKEEVRYLNQLYKNNPYFGGMVAGIDFLDSNIKEKLEFYLNYSCVKGVRQILNSSRDSKYSAAKRKNDLINPLWIKNFSLLEKYNLSFDMQICPEQMLSAFELASLYPNISIVIDHAGMPIPQYFSLWKEGISKLSQCHNVYIKLSGFAMFDHDCHEGSIRDYILHIIYCFGEDRCMFASNFPVDKLYKNYSDMLNDYINIVDRYFYAHKNKLFYETAKHFYKL